MELVVLGKDKRLYFQKSVRINGKPTKKTIEYLGKLDDLVSSTIPDPVSYYKEEAKRRTQIEREAREKRKEENDGPKLMSIPADFSKHLITPKERDEELFNKSFLCYFGEFPIFYVYHEFKLDTFFLNRRTTWPTEENLESYLKLLIAKNILDRNSFLDLKELREKFLLTRKEMKESALKEAFIFLGEKKEELRTWIKEKCQNELLSDKKSSFITVTQYNVPFTLIEKNKKKRIYKKVQLSLLSSSNNQALDFEFNLENKTALDSFYSLKEKGENAFYLSSFILVTDSFLPVSARYSINQKGDCYIIKECLDFNDKELRDFVLDSKGWKTIDSNYAVKKREIEFSSDDKKEILKETQIILFSKDKEKKELEDLSTSDENEIILKSCFLIRSNVSLSKKNPELLFQEPCSSNSENNEKKIKNREIIKELKKLESTKGFFNPATSILPLSNETELNSFFTLSFLSFLILSTLEAKTKNKYTYSQIETSLKNAKLDRINDTYFHNTYFDEVLETLKNYLNLDLTKEFYNKKEIIELKSR